MTKSRKPERFLLRVEKGAFVPADGYTARRLRDKGFHKGDIINARLTKPRSPGFHRLAHVFGQLCAENISDFEGLDAHSVLKRIQLEDGIACDEMLLKADNGMTFVHRIPRSLSFADMDDGEFHEVYRRMTQFVRRKYWEGLTDEALEEMVRLMVREAA